MRLLRTCHIHSIFTEDLFPPPWDYGLFPKRTIPTEDERRCRNVSWEREGCIECRTCRVGGQNAVEISGIATCSVSTSPHHHIHPWDVISKVTLPKEDGRRCRDVSSENKRMDAETFDTLPDLLPRAHLKKTTIYHSLCNQPRGIQCLPKGKASNSV